MIIEDKTVKTIEKSVQFRIINLITLYSAIMCILSLPVFLMINSHMSVVVTIVVFVIAAFVLRIVGGYAHNHKVYYYVYVFMINMILLPMLYIYSGGFFSGMPMLFIAGYILVFMLLDGMALLFSVGIISVWYCIVMSYSYYNPDRLDYLVNDYALLADLLICFIATIMVATTVLWIHTGFYRRMNESLVASKKLLENTSKEKSRFLASMSGELKTPMNAILNMTELLDRDESSNILYERYLIQESTFSLLDTINNIIRYSSLDLGHMELSNKQFSFKKFLSDIIYTFGLEINSNGVHFETDIDPGIPDNVYGDLLSIHDVFQYVLYNSIKSTDDGRIALNIEYSMNELNKAVTIRVSVTDTGMGFTEEEKNSIFSSFEIYDSRKFSQLKKVGLELTICREILKLMNGDMQLDSIEGVGNKIDFWFDLYAVDDSRLINNIEKSGKRALVLVEKSTRSANWVKQFHQFGIAVELIYTAMAFETMIKEHGFEFYLLSDYSYNLVEGIINKYGIQDKCYVLTDYEHSYLDFGKCRILRRPVSCLNLAEIVFDTWRSEDYSDSSSLQDFCAKKARILVVDDGLINLKVISGLLAKYDIMPSVVSTAAEAISKCECEEYDLILADRDMPEMSGFELLNSIRAMSDSSNAGVPVIGLASSLGNAVKEDFLREGFNDCLEKPVKLKELGAILRKYLPEDLISEVDKSEPVLFEAKAEKEDIPAGLQAETGLECCGGDEATYCMILNTFYKEGQGKTDQIEGQLSAGDITNFTINVHAVKSASASIGGLQTSEAYKELEMAGKDQDIEFINSHIERAVILFNDLLKDVEVYLREHNSFEERQETDLSGLEQEELSAGDLELFIQYADEFETSLLEELCEKLAGRNFGEKINPYIAEMLTAVEDFDYDIALEKAKELLEELS